jgi:hypothetical protein
MCSANEKTLPQGKETKNRESTITTPASDLQQKSQQESNSAL